MLKAGDWVCKPCNAVIFASKSKCFKCGFEKPALSSPFRIMDANFHYDWTCSGCNKLIFGKKEYCLKCKIRNPKLPDNVLFMTN